MFSTLWCSASPACAVARRLDLSDASVGQPAAAAEAAAPAAAAAAPTGAGSEGAALAATATEAAAGSPEPLSCPATPDAAPVCLTLLHNSDFTEHSAGSDATGGTGSASSAAAAAAAAAAEEALPRWQTTAEDSAQGKAAVVAEAAQRDCIMLQGRVAAAPLGYVAAALGARAAAAADIAAVLLVGGSNSSGGACPSPILMAGRLLVSAHATACTLYGLQLCRSRLLSAGFSIA